VRFLIPIIVIFGGLLGEALPLPQAARLTVRGTVSLVRTDNSAAKKSDNSSAVVWLKLLPASAERQSSDRATAPVNPRFKIVQQNKKFDPHILAIPVGSTVDFPNLDPFFHNVFSMYDGKRFDLGLYEAGGSHGVRFDSPGICYIFCNIHPDMSAAIVVVDTPYFAISNVAGEFTIANVPPGAYQLNVWHERGKPAKSDVFPREVTISSGAMLPPIRLFDAGSLLVPHKNKYGADYDPAAANPNYNK